MQLESFASEPLQQIINAYLYAEYSDDESLQAFIASYNSLAQGYLEWFNTTPLSVYTSPNITGPLLDWIGQGIYGIERPVLSTLTTRNYGSYNSVPYNTLAYNTRRHVTSGAATQASDDIYKRVLTWHLYLGDGRQMSLMWLRRRIARFIYGVDGSDIPVDYLPEIGLSRPPIGYSGAYSTTAYNTQPYNSNAARKSLSARTILISLPPGQASQDFQILLTEGYLAVPFQVTFTTVIRTS